MTPKERERESSISAIALLDQMLAEIYDGHEESEEAEAVAREWLAEIATNGHNDEIVMVLEAWRKYLEGTLDEN